MMLKYMHDHYLDKYEWFMRADDDVYIKGDKLENFLRSLNSSEPLFLGQTGLGTTEEMGKLALEPGENFCMGGPGVIMSREVLRRMVPHIGECLREMYTTHEDVEVGRCVRRFAGVQCVWSYEVRPGAGSCSGGGRGCRAAQQPLQSSHLPLPLGGFGALVSSMCCPRRDLLEFPHRNEGTGAQLGTFGTVGGMFIVCSGYVYSIKRGMSLNKW